MSQKPAFDSSIPVLTEVVPDQSPAEPEDAEPAAAETTPAATASTEPGNTVPSRQDVVSGQLEALAIDSWTEPEWTVLERRLSERLLLQLQDRVDLALEQQLRGSLAEVLQQAVAGLTGDIRHGLQQSIKQVVARAVADELAQLQTLKR
jgi:hypothetical protein